jgi:hypothetical protein
LHCVAHNAMWQTIKTTAETASTNSSLGDASICVATTRMATAGRCQDEHRLGCGSPSVCRRRSAKNDREPWALNASQLTAEACDVTDDGTGGPHTVLNPNARARAGWQCPRLGRPTDRPTDRHSIWPVSPHGGCCVHSDLWEAPLSDRQRSHMRRLAGYQHRQRRQ